MPAGTRYAKTLNEDLTGIKTPAVYDAVIDEWLMLNGTYVKNNAGIWTPLQLDANGNLKTATPPKNSNLQAKTIVTWNGTDTTRNVEVPVGAGPVLVVVVNGVDQDQDISLSLEHEVEDGVWIPYLGADGTPLSWKVLKNGDQGVYGPVQGWPRFAGGRVVLTATVPPGDTKTTSVQVWEV